MNRQLRIPVDVSAKLKHHTINLIENEMRVVLLIFSILIAGLVNSQTIYFPYYYDSDEIVTTVDSLRIINISQILIVRTERLNICKQKEDSISSIIIWPAYSGLCYLKTICANTIYSPFKANLDKRVLNEKTISELLITKDEVVYKFVPPLTSANTIFYISNFQHGYFELSDNLNNSPITYLPKDSVREKSRHDWFDLVISDLQKVDYSFRLSRYYDRRKEMEIEIEK